MGFNPHMPVALLGAFSMIVNLQTSQRFVTSFSSSVVAVDNLNICRETGETRRLGPTECPLTLRVQVGPHEVTSEYLKDDVCIRCCQEVAKLYLMDVRSTTEISHAVAQYINFSVVELRSFLNMFYEVTTNKLENVTLSFLELETKVHLKVRNHGEGPY